MKRARARCEVQRKILDPQQLLDEARAVARLSGYGDVSFAAPMKRLMERAASEDGFSDKYIEDCRDDVIRYLESKKRLDLDGRSLRCEVRQHRSDIMPDIKEACRRAGRTITLGADAAWSAGSATTSRASAAYSLEEFGLDYMAIDQAFAEYIARFIER